jgi:uncharacterized protein
MPLMSLGMFVFQMDTLAFDELQRTTNWRFARNPRIGARDAVQFVGPGDEDISIGGTAVAELQDGRASLDELRDMADSGDSWALTDGTGQVYGAFIIERMREGHKVFTAEGVPLKIDFGIELSRIADQVPG